MGTAREARGAARRHSPDAVGATSAPRHHPKATSRGGTSRGDDGAWRIIVWILVPIPGPVERHALQISGEVIILSPRVDDARLAREPEWFCRTVQAQSVPVQRVLEHGKNTAAAPLMSVRKSLRLSELDQGLDLVRC